MLEPIGNHHNIYAKYSPGRDVPNTWDQFCKSTLYCMFRIGKWTRAFSSTLVGGAFHSLHQRSPNRNSGWDGRIGIVGKNTGIVKDLPLTTLYLPASTFHPLPSSFRRLPFTFHLPPSINAPVTLFLFFCCIKQVGQTKDYKYTGRKKVSGHEFGFLRNSTKLLPTCPGEKRSQAPQGKSYHKKKISGLILVGTKPVINTFPPLSRAPALTPTTFIQMWILC